MGIIGECILGCILTAYETCANFLKPKRKEREKQFINPYEIVLAMRNRNAQLELSYLKEFYEIKKEKEKLLKEITGSEEEQRQKEKDETVIDEIMINGIVIDETNKKKFLNIYRRFLINQKQKGY